MFRCVNYCRMWLMSPRFMTRIKVPALVADARPCQLPSTAYTVCRDSCVTRLISATVRTRLPHLGYRGPHLWRRLGAFANCCPDLVL
jgi:hypothetical protein